MNPGGIRADLVENGAGDVTYGAAFAVQPFNNLVASMDLTGAEIKAILNQQWNGGNEGTNRKILQVSGLSYTWDVSDAALTDADAIVGDVHGRRRRRPGHRRWCRWWTATTYRVAMNNFIADGGDNFTRPRDQGENRITGGLDIDSLRRLPARERPGLGDADRPDLAAALIQHENDDGAGAVRRPRSVDGRGGGGSADPEQVDDEDQRLAGLDDAAGAAVAVAEVGRDHELPATADLHALHALVPAGDDLADAEPELERRRRGCTTRRTPRRSSGRRRRSGPTRSIRRWPRHRHPRVTSVTTRSVGGSGSKKSISGLSMAPIVQDWCT